VGWHLPDYAEWNTLIRGSVDASEVGKLLKFTSGWKENGNGTNALGFAAKPAGYYVPAYDQYLLEGEFADFWRSTESGSDQAYAVTLSYGDDVAPQVGNLKYAGFSVRCVKDDI
jgi:uncharacterized protein (TIGR02145 family)